MSLKLAKKAVDAAEVVSPAEVAKLGSAYIHLDGSYDELRGKYNRESFTTFAVPFAILLGIAVILYVIFNAPTGPEDYAKVNAEVAQFEAFFEDVCSPKVGGGASNYDGKHLVKTIKTLETLQSKCLSQE